MKPRIVRPSQILTAALLLVFLPAGAYSLETPAPANPQPGINVPAPRPAPKTVWMSHEATEVLKLVRAHVTEDVVMAFIENSRAGFSLTADEIVQLHNEGVSDKMIQAMLARRKAPPATVSVAQEAPQPQPMPPQQVIVQQPAQPSVTYVPSEPVYVTAPTTTYVYPEPYYSYYDPYPFYGGYSGWYPRVSFNFGFRNGFYGGHYRYGGSWGHSAPGGHFSGGFHGGYSGGWHGGGGFHGGGHHR
jgi:hypothetical protein